MRCRNCGSDASLVFADLRSQPLSNSYLRPEDLDKPEITYPLRPVICPDCRLVQLPDLVSPEAIFREYAYFSGQSNQWIRHCGRYADEMLDRHDIRKVLEIASNDGTLLAEFQDRHVQVLGVEPARNVAWQAQTFTGVPTIPEFFGMELAWRLADYHPDLIVANNVLAHVPDFDDFLGGCRRLMGDGTVATFEVPHLARQIQDDDFSQIYMEHRSYFGFITVQRILSDRGLRVFDVEEIDTHGGSLRLHVCRFESPVHQTQASVPQLSRWEQENAFWDPDALAQFAERPPEIKRATLRALGEVDGPIALYGAPAKGNTFLNYCGIGAEMIAFAVDSTPAKQGTYLPGSRIPVLAPDALNAHQPQTIFVTASNWEAEITAKIAEECPWNPTVICRPWRAKCRA